MRAPAHEYARLTMSKCSEVPALAVRVALYTLHVVHITILRCMAFAGDCHDLQMHQTDARKSSFLHRHRGGVTMMSEASLPKHSS